MRNLLRLLAARNAAFVAWSALLLAGFQYLICAAVGSVDVSGALQLVLRSLPPMLQTMIASTMFGGLTPSGLLAFGWNHPIAQAAGTAVAIVLGMRAVAGEAETGALELLLTQPLSRAAWLAAQVGFGFVALALVTAAGLAGTLAGQAVFGLGRFTGVALLRLGLGFLLLQAAWFGVALLVSAFAREGGRVASIVFLVALASYLANVIGHLLEHAAFILPWTLSHYFSPQDILVEGRGQVRPELTLAAVGLAGVVLAWLRFRRRDLP
jgi:ABC-2 type transport system permease protein